MRFIDQIFSAPGYFDHPQGVEGWIIFSLMLAGNFYLAIRWRKFNRKISRVRMMILILLFISTLVFSLVIGLHIPVTDSMPVPGKTSLPTGAAMMFLSAIPWCVAAGYLGPVWSGGLAGLSGLVIGYFDHHNLFLPVVNISIGLVFSFFIRQTYRTLIYRLLRHPLLAGLLVSLLYVVLIVISMVYITSGAFVVRLGYALAQMPTNAVAFIGTLILGAIVAQVLYFSMPQYWLGEIKETPSPAEASLESNLVYRLMPLVIIFSCVLLVVIGWFWVDGFKRQLVSQMENVAEASAATIPFSLETGQNMIVRLAEDPRILETDDPELLQEVLVDYLKRVPFFNQLTYLNAEKEVLAAYPFAEVDPQSFTLQEQQAIDLAKNGVGFQMYSLEPEPGDDIGRLVFISSVDRPEGQVGVVMGHTYLDENPLFIPVLESLDLLTPLGGAGMLVGEQGLILYHPDPSRIGTIYPQEINLTESYFDPRYTDTDGRQVLLYTYPVPGRSWVVVTTLPLSVAHQAGLQQSVTLLVMLAVLLFGLYKLLQRVVRAVIREISRLADDAGQIAAGDLDKALETEHVDEVGKLARAVDGMRISLKARMDDLDQLLTVSKGVAASLDLQSAVAPILQGALSTGATSARLVLSDSAAPEFNAELRTRYGAGPSTKIYRNLDLQVLKMAMQQPEVLLSNPARARLQNLGYPLPGALLAEVLEHEGVQYGALWIAYDEAHPFSEDEKRFIRAIAGQAALAVSNARLYLSAQLGRQRMEEILASTPEPVIVTDAQNRFLLANPPAQEVLGHPLEALAGQPVEKIVQQPALRNLLISDLGENSGVPREVQLANKNTYYVTSSPIVMEGGKNVGRVCLLSDITRFKELDEMKSDFVDTVSHDLRSPLTTIRGYATMLDMVGDLNEQQARYVQKISESVERMHYLVDTLLDIGRIEAGVDLKLEWLMVSDLVRQVAEDLRLNAVQKRINYQVNLPAGTEPMVQADRALLEQAVQNVIDNAIKYTHPGGDVKISVRFEQDALVAIRVEDTGSGIAPVDEPRLFERFYRGAGRAGKKDGSSGLGLAIVKSIIDRHHGSIQVQTRLGEGSAFTLRIPLKQPE
ncbi:MAG: HAMP domain-containing protein [Anaerolineales bacterium]|nr:HAMP domain-containing protein [Anaerolineales bacterium]